MMIYHIKIFFVSLVLLISSNVTLAAPVNSDYAVPGGDYGLEETVQKSGLNRTGYGDIPTLAGKYVGILLQFVGVVFFLLIIWGGVRWMIARGDANEAGKAKDIIIDATIGLIIIMSAYAITSYIGNLLTK